MSNTSIAMRNISEKRHLRSGAEGQELKTQRTEVIEGLRDARELAFDIVSNASGRYCICYNKSVPEHLVKDPYYTKIFRKAKEKNLRVQSITEITKENVKYCKQLMRQFGFEFRHIDEVKGRFCIADDRHYIATSISENKQLKPQTIYTNVRSIVDQNQYLFDTLWSKATPAEQKIQELESGFEQRKLQLVTDFDELMRIQVRTIRSTKKNIDSYYVSLGAVFTIETIEIRTEFEKAIARGVRIRNITEITNENIPHCKALMKMGVQLRHMAAISGSFGISESDCIAAIYPEETRETPQYLYTNYPQFVEHNRSIFRTLWETAVPASVRLRQLEEGIEVPVTEVISDQGEIRTRFMQELSQAASNIRLMIPTVAGFRSLERTEFVRILERMTKEKGVKVRILCPLDPYVEKSAKSLGWWLSEPREDASPDGKVVFHAIDLPEKKGRIALALIDEKQGMMMGIKDDFTEEFVSSVSFAVCSNSAPVVTAFIAFFEKLWHQSELSSAERTARRELVDALAREERLRKGAELLQDILAHDIRNYNQVTLLGVETLQEELSQNRRVEPILQTIVQSVKGSTSLLERAKKLGKIVSESNPKLESVDLLEIIKDSLTLVRAANPKKKIIETGRIGEIKSPEREIVEGKKIYVLADDLLHDVFSNLYANSVRYTDGEEVQIETKVEEAALPGNSNESGLRDDSKQPSDTYIRISIADNGRGIEDDQKSRIFSRYLKGAKGTGLGLSIVGALVLERYKGMIYVRDRVRGDASKGTITEIYLRKAAI